MLNFLKRFSGRAAALWYAGLWLIAVFPAGGQEIQQFPLNEQNGSSLEVEQVFSAVPPGGYTALRLTVTNKGKEALALTVSTISYSGGGRDEHTLSSGGVSFATNPESTATKELIVPLMPVFSGRGSYNYFANCTLGVSVSGAARGVQASFRGAALQGMPFAGISQSLAGKSAVALNDAARSVRSAGTSGYSTGENFLASFLPGHLPADWRGYLGLDLLALNADEWNTLLPGVRTAIRQWIVLGGVLDLYHSGPLPQAILQELKTGPEEKGRRVLGSGGVRTFPWDGKELLPDVLGRFDSTGQKDGGIGIRQLAVSRNMREVSPTEPGAGLIEALGIRSFAAWQVGVILVIFGLLVGPVNLFYLAGPGRRHRLFFTTPVIALGASLVLIAVILLQDGSGGGGQRAALIELRPDENNAYVRQYQISRTGVLFGGGFVMDEPAAVAPLLLDNSRWTRLKPRESNESEGQRYALPEPQAYAGDWFQSRSEQAQLIEAIRPGRGRLELKPGAGDPVLVSSLSGTVERIFYQDPAGQWWASPGPLATGASATLEASDEAAFRGWLEPVAASFPPADRQQLLSQAHQGRFYAISRDPAVGLVDTLKSIRWSHDLAILHGRLAPLP